MTTWAGNQETESADDLFAWLLSPHGIEDPYPSYVGLRRIAPVHTIRRGQYVLTRWAECDAVLRNPDCQVLGAEHLDTRSPGWRNSPAMAGFHQSMLGQNGDAHARSRRLASRTFTPRRVEALRADVEHHVERFLDEMAEHGGSVFDLQKVLSFPLPVAVIGSLLGVPAPDWPQFELLVRDLSAVLEPQFVPAQAKAADAAALVMREYFTDLVADRRKSPREDLVSAMATAQEENRLTEPELVSTLILIFAAGFETTVNLIGNGVMALYHHPDQAARLRADPSLAANTVDEVLRWDAPVHGTSRITRRRVRLADVNVPPGSDVLVLMGSANRDPERFAEPDRFDIGRSDAHSALGFGAGAHYCLGASLARLEAAALLRRVTERFPTLGPAGTPVRRTPGLAIRGFTYLPVAIGG